MSESEFTGLKDEPDHLPIPKNPETYEEKLCEIKS